MFQTIVTGAGDETLRFWNVFPSPKSQVNNSLTIRISNLTCSLSHPLTIQKSGSLFYSHWWLKSDWYFLRNYCISLSTNSLLQIFNFQLPAPAGQRIVLLGKPLAIFSLSIKVCCWHAPQHKAEIKLGYGFWTLLQNTDSEIGASSLGRTTIRWSFSLLAFFKLTWRSSNRSNSIPLAQKVHQIVLLEPTSSSKMLAGTQKAKAVNRTNVYHSDARKLSIWHIYIYIY